MSEIVNPTAAIETPPTTDPEPEGVKDVQGEKVVPLSALVAERDRVRNAEREKLTREYEPVKQQLAQTQQQAQQLAAELDALRAAHAPKPPDIPDVSNDEAERYARRYELYTAQGLDIGRAKQIIADNRAETRKIAQQVAAEAVSGPQQEMYRQTSRQNFVWAANQRDANGQPLVDARTLAEQWAKLPAELTANPEVAQHLLKTVAGEMLMSGKRPTVPSYEPAFTEPPGGRQPSYQMDPIAKRLARTAGISEKDFIKTAQAYVPGATNFLE